MSPTRTETPSPSVSSTASASRTPTGTKTPLPTGTGTKTISATATPTRTLTTAFSRTPSPSFTPSPVVATYVHGMILTLYDDLVVDLGTYGALRDPRELSLSANPYSPERDGNLFLNDGTGRGLVWNGLNADGSPVPNGRYKAVLVDAGNHKLEQVFTLEHLDSKLTVEVHPEQNPVRTGSAILRYDLGQDSRIRSKIFDLRGNLVWAWETTGKKGRVVWNLRTSSGQSISAGIYLWVVDFESLSGDGQEERVLKLAILR
jgi:hypothetical protein